MSSCRPSPRCLHGSRTVMLRTLLHIYLLFIKIKPNGRVCWSLLAHHYTVHRMLSTSFMCVALLNDVLQWRDLMSNVPAPVSLAIKNSAISRYWVRAENFAAVEDNCQVKIHAHSHVGLHYPHRANNNCATFSSSSRPRGALTGG